MNLYRRFTAALVATLLLLCLIPAWAESPAEYDINAPQNLVAGHLFAESALLVDEDSGEVLFTKNSRVRMYPASTTKIMTLLLALESDIPLDGQVTIPPEAAQIPEGSSVIPVQPGDVMKFEDLLYGFMLSSGNDGANAIAVLVDGGIEPFVARMNARAQELGLEGTHYVNAHGYHDSEHYTTAQDLANLSRFAMQSEAFRRIVAAPKWTMSVQRGGQEVSLDIVSRNSLLQNDQKYYYPDCTGIKTGHHNKAGWCFVGSAERDGMRVICVVLNCAQENDKWYDAARLFEYGFTSGEYRKRRSCRSPWRRPCAEYRGHGKRRRHGEGRGGQRIRHERRRGPRDSRRADRMGPGADRAGVGGRAAGHAVPGAARRHAGVGVADGLPGCGREAGGHTGPGDPAARAAPAGGNKRAGGNVQQTGLGNGDRHCADRAARRRLRRAGRCPHERATPQGRTQAQAQAHWNGEGFIVPGPEPARLSAIRAGMLC